MHQRWIVVGSLLAVLIGIGSGLASSLFLIALEHATDLQADHPWLLFLLPLGGAFMAWLYRDFGGTSSGGNNLILDQIHDPAQVGRIPFRMLPLILVSTVLTHLFGGSAGREGAAVQMGGAISAAIGRRLHVTSTQLRIALMCGVSGGFSSVFGTPIAGTIFGMEMLAIGGMRYEALIPCLIAAIAGDLVVRQFPITHSHYAITSAIPSLSVETVLQIALAGIAFGLASLAFSESTALVERVGKRLVPNPIGRIALGGIIVILVTLLLGTRLYNGLSLPLLHEAFTGEVPTWAFLFKLILTAITLGVGFKGGEVTPLFVIGATLGVTLADPLGMPTDLLAAIGFVAVFAAAANTPIACVVLAGELFGTQGLVFFAIAIFIAYTISGHRGIYGSQRILAAKDLRDDSPLVGKTIREIRERTPRS